MTTQFLTRTILSFARSTCDAKSTLCVLGKVNYKKFHTDNIPPKEIKIPVQWGHISAKVWGDDSNHRPILALHGWQDNAGTWDSLAPMLLKNRAIMAVDFPGHGLSSRIPAGMCYYSWDLPRFILLIQEYFKWDKVSILAHSMGSIASLRFASTFPDHVDFFVGLDTIIHDDYGLDFVIDKYPTLIQKSLDAQSRLDKEPPSYTMEQIKLIWHSATNKSVELDSVQYLANRGILPSKADPNKFYFSRDSRLKHILFIVENKKFVEALIRRVKCPILYIKANDSPYATEEYSIEMCDILEKNNPQFERQFVPGTHHVHLNNPERVAPLILNFFSKYNIPT